MNKGLLKKSLGTTLSLLLLSTSTWGATASTEAAPEAAPPALPTETAPSALPAEATPPASQAKATPPASQAKVQAPPPDKQAAGNPLSKEREIVLPLKDLGYPTALRRIGAESQAGVDFSFQSMDVIKKLQLELHYSYAPILNAEVSSLKIYLNGHELTSIPLVPDKAKERVSLIDIDPLLVQEWNHLTFQIAEQADEKLMGVAGQTLCTTDPRSPLLWIEFNQKTTAIKASAIRLPVINDLSLFPVPFFDRHDPQNQRIHFAFTEHPSWSALKAAGILASRFGQLAEWRSTQFSAHLGKLPQEDAIVFATVQDQIEGLTLPAVADGVATVSVVDNPANPDTKLLLVVGQNAEGLIGAAQALAMDKLTMKGESVSAWPGAIPQRTPLDAPAWLPVGKKTLLSDLLPKEQLTTKGLFVSPLSLNLHLPPNLYRGEATKIPFDFKFETSNGNRYLARIDASLNGVPFQHEIGDINATNGHYVFNIPTWNVTGRDTLTLAFTYANKSSVCSNEKVYDEIRIDPTSSIDLTGIPKYLEMPRLSYLAYTGYPFSRMADLSETVALLPEQPTQTEIESMLTVVGHISNKTAYPATGLTVASIAEAEQVGAGKDILVIGGKDRLKPLIATWQDDMQIDPLGNNHPWPYIGTKYVQRLADWSLMSENMLEEDHTFLVAFESPLQSKRSVVMISSNNEQSLSGAISTLTTFAKAKDFIGDVTLYSSQDNKVHSYQIGRSFATGELTIWEQFRRLLYHSPFTAAFLAFVIAILFSAMAYHILKKLSQDKLK